MAAKLPLKYRLIWTLHGFVTQIACRPNYTVNRPLINLFDLKVSPSTAPRDGVATSDTIVDASRNLWFRLYTPTATSSGAVIVYFHGGGFSHFSASSTPYDNFCRVLSKDLSAIVISVNYRLSPEHRFPSQYDDGFDTLKFLDANVETILPAGADPKKCFLAGDSAGGNLSHHVAVRAGQYEFRNVNIIGLVAIQPFFGGEERTESEIRLAESKFLGVERTDWFWKAFLPEGSNRDHPAANVITGKWVEGKFPGAFVVVGELDLLQDRQREYCEVLRKAGKEVKLLELPNAFHGFYVVPELPEYSLFMKQLSDFIQKHLSVP